MSKVTRLIFTFLLLNLPLWAGEYTNTFKVRLKEVLGESQNNDPVESFNDAINNGMKSAISRGQVMLKGYSESQDSVLSETWIQKSAHLQVIDLQVGKYKFSRHPSGSLLTELQMEVTMEYLDIPRFVYDYEKTVQGATYRSMAIPGWGQLYNNQYTTSVLYGVAFWSFYGLFINAMNRAGNNPDRVSEAVWNFQVPAIIFWSFNVSEAATSRYLGRQGLDNLKRAYRFEPEFKYEPMTERGVKVDFILFQVPLSRLWE